MRRLAHAYGLVAAALCLSCGPAAAPTLTDAERGAIADSIRGITHVFAEALNALDVDRFAPLFASDPELTWAGDGQLMPISHDSLMSFYRAVYRGFRKMDFAWDTLRVSVLSADAGVLSGAGHYAVTDTTGRTVRQGVAVTYVFVRRNGQWQLLHGHASHRLLPD